VRSPRSLLSSDISVLGSLKKAADRTGPQLDNVMKFPENQKTIFNVS
jgi:hypothetical protein